MSAYWERLGMDRVTFRDHPRRTFLIQKMEGIKIHDCCELRKLKDAFGRPVSTLLEAYRSAGHDNRTAEEEAAYREAQIHYDNLEEI